MKYSKLLFDLDGTISDPSQGITRSINYALASHDLKIHDEKDLLQFIGPPLHGTMALLSDSNDSKLIASLVAKYRERYNDVGFMENKLYPGVKNVLSALSHSADCSIAICTSKPSHIATRVLRHFELENSFEFVSGGENHANKIAQITTLLAENKTDRHAVMIGDRSYDLLAASSNGMDSVGVLWGFGSESELLEHKPIRTLEKPEQLLELVF